MTYITGDTHIPCDISKLKTKRFPESKKLSKNDFLIICGDFGGVWNNDNEHRPPYNKFSPQTLVRIGSQIFLKNSRRRQHIKHGISDTIIRTERSKRVFSVCLIKFIKYKASEVNFISLVPFFTYQKLTFGIYYGIIIIHFI